MRFQCFRIADLIPAAYNPRKKLKPGDKEYEKIKKSIQEFGYEHREEADHRAMTETLKYLLFSVRKEAF